MESSHNAETDSADKRQSGKTKKRRGPESLGSLAVVSERKEPDTGRIGHMLMAAEAEPTARAGRTALEGAGKDSERLARSLSGRRAETMSRSELLELSEHIMIDGSSLRQIYETHLVGERGLRRLMAEYQHDGDLKKALRQEIIEREIDFERDPAVRDMAAYQAPADDSSGTTGKAALKALLDKAAEAAEGRNEETAFFKARARFEARELHQHKQRRRLLDLATVLIILILLTLIAMLSMSRL